MLFLQFVRFLTFTWVNFAVEDSWILHFLIFLPVVSQWGVMKLCFTRILISCENTLNKTSENEYACCDLSLRNKQHFKNHICSVKQYHPEHNLPTCQKWFGTSSILVRGQPSVGLLKPNFFFDKNSDVCGVICADQNKSLKTKPGDFRWRWSTSGGKCYLTPCTLTFMAITFVVYYTFFTYNRKKH